MIRSGSLTEGCTSAISSDFSREVFGTWHVTTQVPPFRSQPDVAFCSQRNAVKTEVTVCQAYFSHVSLKSCGRTKLLPVQLLALIVPGTVNPSVNGRRLCNEGVCKHAATDKLTKYGHKPALQKAVSGKTIVVASETGKEWVRC